METSLGIDLASQNENTATCLIEWRRGHARAAQPRLGSDQSGNTIGWLTDAARGATWVGIDAPFGKGYKTRGTLALRPAQKEARAALLDQLQDHAPWLDLSAAREACVESDHAPDALIASLIARAAAMRLTDSPAEDELDRLRREGWIHLPRRDSLPLLAEAPESGAGNRAE